MVDEVPDSPKGTVRKRGSASYISKVQEPASPLSKKVIQASKDSSFWDKKKPLWIKLSPFGLALFGFYVYLMIGYDYSQPIWGLQSSVTEYQMKLGTETSIDIMRYYNDQHEANLDILEERIKSDQKVFQAWAALGEDRRLSYFKDAVTATLSSDKFYYESLDAVPAEQQATLRSNMESSIVRLAEELFFDDITWQWTSMDQIPPADHPQWPERLNDEQKFPHVKTLKHKYTTVNASLTQLFQMVYEGQENDRNMEQRQERRAAEMSLMVDQLKGALEKKDSNLNPALWTDEVLKDKARIFRMLKDYKIRLKEAIQTPFYEHAVRAQIKKLREKKADAEMLKAQMADTEAGKAAKRTAAVQEKLRSLILSEFFVQLFAMFSWEDLDTEVKTAYVVRTHELNIEMLEEINARHKVMLGAVNEANAETAKLEQMESVFPGSSEALMSEKFRKMKENSEKEMKEDAEAAE